MDVQRWILNLAGAALLAAPLLMSRLGVHGLLGTTDGASAMDGISGWLNLSIAAGAYLINWSPVLLGGLLIFYANRRRR